MKKIITFSICLIAILSGNYNTYSQEIGANFNESIENISPLLIEKSGVNWVRGFVNIPRFFLKINKENQVIGVNEKAIKEFDMSPLTSLKNKKIILSFKLDFKHKNMGVTLENTAAEGFLLNAIELFLKEKNLGNKIEILVVGNEPMWETPNGQSRELGKLTNKLITKVNQLKTTNQWHYQIFVGALNRVSELTKNEVAQEIIKIAKENPLVDGLDLHIHTNDISIANADPAYIRNTMMVDKKLICTEFSMVRLFEKHINDKLGQWGEKNGYDKNLKLYEWINLLTENAKQGNPISSAKFYDYFDSQNWYPKQWFNGFLNSFKQNNVSIATYGLQSKLTNKPKLLTEKSQLWILNFVFNGSLFGNSSNGLGNLNPIVYPEFKEALN